MPTDREGGQFREEWTEEITELILQHRTILFGFIVSQTGSYDNAEDLFQEVCLTICRKYGEFERGTNFKAWAMQIARNKVLNYYQRSGVERRKVQLTDAVADLLAEDPVWLEDANPFHREIVAMRHCLEKMKGKNRQLLLHRYGEEMTCDAIAKAVNWSAGSVYVALSRLRDALRKCIQTQLTEMSLCDAE